MSPNLALKSEKKKGCPMTSLPPLKQRVPTTAGNQGIPSYQILRSNGLFPMAVLVFL